MTKKNYIAFASMMNELIVKSKEWENKATLDMEKGIARQQARSYHEVLHKLADVCQEDNPRFNRDKFIDACYKNVNE